MKKIAAGVFLFLSMVTISAVAETSVNLNSISYQVIEQQWVKSKQATATVTINATLSDQNTARLRQSMMNNLEQIAKGDWHIIQFNRSRTTSGLESVKALAQIRLPTKALDEIYQKTKRVSQAGLTYTVSSLNFNPDMEDIIAAQTTLRQKIYANVQTELKNLNKQFPNANYFVHQINFLSGQPIIPKSLSMMSGSAALPNVSQKLTLRANVVLASQIKALNNND